MRENYFKIKFGGIKIATIFFFTSLITFGCKKLIEVDLPIDRTTSVQTFNDVITAAKVMTGIYAQLRTLDMNIRPSMMGDEIQRSEGDDEVNYRNNLSPSNFQSFNIWEPIFGKYIYGVNSLIEGVNASSIAEDKKKILLGEAKFIRAYLYFYLVSYYGEVPLVLTTDYKINANISKSSKADVFKQIISDLNYAEENLTNDFLSSNLSTTTSERVRPNKIAAEALLARVYLYNSQWADAEEEATKVIGNGNCEVLKDLNKVFLKNSREAIWQMQPEIGDDGNANTADAREFIPRTGSFPLMRVSPNLQKAFEPNDLRKLNWTTSVNYGPDEYQIFYKYKIGNTTGGLQNQDEYYMILRLSEQYLIRSEARARLGNLLGAAEDLNVIRKRAGLDNTISSTPEELLGAILHERQVELFTEQGHRWLDLRRTGNLDQVMGAPGNVCQLKGGTWSSYKGLVPIPASEFSNNPSMRGHQNPGYPER